MEQVPTNDRAARWTFILAMIAAALALSAALVHYTTAAEFRWPLIAAGIVLIAFGLNAKRNPSRK